MWRFKPLTARRILQIYHPASQVRKIISQSELNQSINPIVMEFRCHTVCARGLIFWERTLEPCKLCSFFVNPDWLPISFILADLGKLQCQWSHRDSVALITVCASGLLWERTLEPCKLCSFFINPDIILFNLLFVFFITNCLRLRADMGAATQWPCKHHIKSVYPFV